MTNIPYEWVNDWQDAPISIPDQPVVLVWVRGTGNRYMRYHGEFYLIDAGSYSYGVVGRRWSIAGVGFTNDSIAWMLDNSIAYPFSQEDLVLYQLTWNLCCE